MRIFLRLMGFSLGLIGLTAPCALAGEAVHWEPWSEAAFARAKAEKKLLILDLEAVWCHWCHVMDEVTYQDKAVIQLLNSHFVALKVDQDARPDLSNRYEDYGWPATILFDSEGHELAKRSGYIAPGSMVSMLKAFVADPTPGPSAAKKESVVYAESSLLGQALANELRKSQDDLYDQEKAGWGKGHKYLEWFSAEDALQQARAGDKSAAAKVRATMDAALNLIDPVWGGVYQYSVERSWQIPHYEKIMQYQAEVMRIYALAYNQFQDPAYLKAGRAIERFVATFLVGPEGGFYTSMDADQKQGDQGDDYFRLDDAGRRKRGVPRVDTNRYARENGWMIQALTELYAADDDGKTLDLARGAAAWVVEQRSLPGGGFKHGDHDPGGPYLGDTLAMGRAFLGLYLVTGTRAYLDRAEAAASFIQATFANPGGPGYITARLGTGDQRAPVPNRDEMIQLARFSNLLHHVTGDTALKTMADTALRFLLSPQVARKVPTAGVLLAAGECARAPTHITIVGPKGDAKASALFQAALHYPSAYKRLEWWDRGEGPLRAMDVAYPTLKNAAAFACSGSRCSLPLTDPATLVQRIEQLNSKG